MIVPSRLSLRLPLRKKNFDQTKTTHKEELEYFVITLVELMRIMIENLKKKFRGVEKVQKVDI